MKATVDRLVQRLAGSRTVFYQAAFVFLLLTAGGVMAGATACPGDQDTDDTFLDSAQPEPSKKHSLLIQRAGVNTSQVTIGSPGPPHPVNAIMHWRPPPGATNIRTNPQGHNWVSFVSWELPVNQTTGKTETVTVSYDPPPGATRVTDTFEVWSSLYGEGVAQSVTRPVSGGGSQAAPSSPAWAQPARPAAAPADSYYRWGMWLRFRPTAAQTMTASLCQDQMALLQGGHAFLALRFPVYPPTLAYTEPYTLPVVVDPTTPRLILKNEGVGPSRVITVPLEYKPEYHTFLENELPAAPGEHWLALGAVATPTVDCAGVPTLSDWSYEANIWLDFGGAQEAGRDSVLPLYYCYEGQTPPMTLPGATADAASYQGWGITCLGPHALRLAALSPLELDGMHTAWVTPTQTISLHHSVWNWSMTAPITVSLTHSSTLGLPWGIYSGTADAPDMPLTPITSPFRLELYMPNQVRHFWLIATVPEGTPAGAETLVITATDVTSPTRSARTTDLLWVGGWVAPPGPPLWHRRYLPLALRR